MAKGEAQGLDHRHDGKGHPRRAGGAGIVKLACKKGIGQVIEGGTVMVIIVGTASRVASGGDGGLSHPDSLGFHK